MSVECTKCGREYPGAVSGCDCCSDLAAFIEDLERTAKRAEQFVQAARCIVEEWDPETETFESVVEALEHELQRYDA